MSDDIRTDTDVCDCWTCETYRRRWNPVGACCPNGFTHALSCEWNQLRGGEECPHPPLRLDWGGFPVGDGPCVISRNVTSLPAETTLSQEEQEAFDALVRDESLHRVLLLPHEAKALIGLIRRLTVPSSLTKDTP